MTNSLSLLKFLRELSNEKERTIENLNELSFYKFFDDLPKNSPYVTISNTPGDFYFRIKRPFSSKTAEDRRIQELYREFLNLYYIIHNETEESELLIGNGILSSKDLPDSYYPVFTKKANIILNAPKEFIEIGPSNSPARIDIKLLSKVQNISPLELKRASEEVKDNFYDPFISAESNQFLKGLTKRLHLDGKVLSVDEATDSDSSFILLERNLFMLAPKFSREVEVFEEAVEREAKGQSQFIIDAISGDGPLPKKNAYDEELDVLFTKEFNREQSDILKNSYESPITLVDGPPGTGKTHTVANMIGHFLAEGKRVLILSKKKKALRVIKNMIDPGFAGLVVSRVKDSNDDIRETLYYINDFILNHTTPEMEAKAKRIKSERHDIITRMNETKKNVLDILESESKEIKVGNDTFSPVEAARFVVKNKDIINLIPGEVERLQTFPLTDDELDYIYTTNKEVTETEEILLKRPLPSIDELISPEDLKETIASMDMIEFNELKFLPLTPQGTKLTDEGVQVDSILIDEMSDISEVKGELEKLKAYMNLPLYKENALKAGLNLIDNRAYNELSRKALLVDEYREKHIETLTGKSIVYPDMPREDVIEALENLEGIYGKKDKPGTFDTLFKKNLKNVIQGFTINGEPIRGAKDANDAIILMNYDRILSDLKAQYDELITDNGGPDFSGYFRNKDEIFQNLETLYNFKDLYIPLIDKLSELLPAKIINKIAPAKKNPTSEVLGYLSTEIYNLLELANLHINEYIPLNNKIQRILSTLNDYVDADVPILYELINEIKNKKTTEYAADYDEYKVLSRKKDIVLRRSAILSKLSCAPSWREFIEKRFGEHGGDTVPDGIKTAFMANVLNNEIQRIVKSPYEKMRKMLSWYKKSIIEQNREYAKTLAWYHFLKRMDENPEIRQSIKGLELTYKKLGKGTGFDAKELQKKAEELLTKCQQFVPCWIMTIDDAIQNVVFKNKFDVTVVDEASQADVLALPLLYTSNKLIAIGDDKQTTPLYGNIPLERVQNLRETMLSKDFPNFHLMDLSTSFYDILKTTFPSFLLSEEFRSVPDIIEFVNNLSYDGKILPLRDENDTTLKPALNLVKVDGVRDGDINEAEKEKIVEMILDIIKNPEYEDKTIGVITLLGSAQAKAINDRLMEMIDTLEYDRRKIMAGTAIDFQGDERDVMFISMVDSPKDSPLRLLSEGAEEINKKRFNVAFSRARDQEFLVTSLSESDLKTGDLRLAAIEYFNEKSHEREKEERKLTPFEMDIMNELEKRDFIVTNNHTAGRYPLPLVVENPKVAIETPEEKTGIKREELEKQLETSLLLERVGWKLAHIRESKYVYEGEAAIDELVQNIMNKR